MVQDLSNSPFCWHNFNKRFYVKYGLENMTPSFRERVREIMTRYAGRTSVNDYPDRFTSITDQSLAEILSLVRGIVPDYEYNPDHLVAEEGFFACRQAILNEIGEGDATRKHDGGL